MFVLLFYSRLFVIFFNFLQWNLPKVFTANCILGDTNFKHEKSRLWKGSVLDFCKVLSYRCKKCLIDFLEN